MNLLEEMGLKPFLTHGILESGKDIVCKETNEFGMTEWIGLVVKLGKITGSTSGSSSIQTIWNQVQEAFLHPFLDSETKSKVYMSKVLVVSNDQILSTAREKIPDKVLSLPASANIHFIDGGGLAKLLDARWPDFWKTHLKVFAVSDPMSPEVGKILYVVALAHTHHARPAKQKPAHLSEADIIKQTGFDEATVTAGLDYLLQRHYLERLDDTGGYTLDRTLTAGRLLTEPGYIRLLELLSEKANSTRHLSWKQIKQVAKKSGYDSKFVKRALGLFLRGSYFERDKSRGKNHYIVIDGMLQDEEAYLKCWLKYRGVMPKQNSE